MIFGKTKAELKVGIFVFVGLVILFSFVMLIGNFKTWTSGYHIYFNFGFINGVKIGAPVRYAGMDVGEVRNLAFVRSPGGSPKIRIECWVEKDTKIPVDSTVWVNTLGLLGEKYIEIMPGENLTDILSGHGELNGQDPIPMHEVTVLMKKIATDINEGMIKIQNKEGTLGKLIYDDSVYKNLDAFVADIRQHPWKLFIKGKEEKKK